jgi:virginiamycin B lyase
MGTGVSCVLKSVPAAIAVGTLCVAASVTYPHREVFAQSAHGLQLPTPAVHHRLNATVFDLKISMGDGARFAPGTYEFTVFELPIPNGVPAILDIDPSGRVWFVIGGGGFAGIHHAPLHYIGAIDVSGQLEILPLPTSHSLPSGIKVDGGTAYITEYLGNRIAILDLATRSVREYAIPTADSRPTGLDVDSHGNVWFNQNAAGAFSRLSSAGAFTEFSIPTSRSRPTGLLVDRMDRVWFSEMFGNKIGMLDPLGTLVEFAIPTPEARPTAIMEDAEGRIWFSERAANQIGVIENDAIREYRIPTTDAGPFFVIDGGDDGVWFTQLYSSGIGRLDKNAGTFGEIDLPIKNSWPAGLGFDDVGNLWVTFQLTNQIGVIRNREWRR